MADDSRERVTLVLKEFVRQWHNTNDLDEKLQIARVYIRYHKVNVKYLQDDISEGVPKDAEVWRNCKKWEYLYQVSNFGRIKGHETFFIKTTKGRTMSVYKPELIRNTRKDKFGYLKTSFWLKEQAKHFHVHRLVAIHFIPNPKKYPQVMHIDNNASNAHFTNLKWGTQKHNIQHAVISGRWHTGSKNNKAKLKESDIPEIRKLLASGKSAYSIAPLFGVSKGQILSIKHRRTWGHVQ